MDRYIPTMRGKIIEGMKSDERLINAHRRIVEGFVEGNYLKGRQGLNLHFRYIYDVLTDSWCIPLYGQCCYWWVCHNVSLS